MLGTPPSGWSPKVREDKTSGAMKPMSRASAEMARLVGPRVGRRRQAKTGRHKRPDEEWSVGPSVFVDQVKEDRLELWALLSYTARRLGFGNHVYIREYDRCKGAKE